MDSDLTWLHLSDLHACQRTGWDARRVSKKLEDDLETLAAAQGLCPDLIFFTGDAAFGHLPNAPLDEQFDIAFALLEKIRALCGVERRNVFVVPGNHDVDRGEVLAQSTEWLDSLARANDLDAIQHLFVRRGKELEVVMARLAAYRRALEGHGYHHLLDDDQRLVYSARRTVNDIELTIAGLDSAWSCGRDGEKGRLWMAGDWQLAQVEPALDEAHLRIGLVHHPLGWLCEAEAPSLEPLFDRCFDFHLHGHEHKVWVESRHGGAVRIAAGACYDRSDRPNGYNLVRLDFAEKRGEIWLRQYERDGGGWVARPVHGRAPDGVWPLAGLSCFERGAAEPMGVGPSEPVVLGLVEEVFDALAGNSIVLLLAQDCHEPTRVVRAIEARAAESRRCSRLVVPAGEMSEAEAFEHLSGQVGLDKPCASAGAWERAFKDKLSGQPHCLVITGFSRAGAQTRQTLGGTLRVLAEQHDGDLWVVLVGGEALAELKYELGQNSVLSSAADEIEWPELTPADVMRRAEELSLVLGHGQAKELAETSGGDCRLVRHVLRCWRRDVDEAEEPLRSILGRSPVLTALFSPYRQREEERQRLLGWLENGDLGPHRPWPADPLLRRLFWDGALRAVKGRFRWRSAALVEVGLEVLR